MENQTVKSMLEQGYTKTRIADFYGLTRQRIGQYVTKNFPEYKENKGARRQCDYAEMYNLAVSGLSLEDIQRRTGLHAQMIVRAVRVYSKEIKASVPEGFRERVRKVELAKVVALHNQGWTKRKIADLYGVDQKYIYKLLNDNAKRHNLPKPARDPKGKARSFDYTAVWERLTRGETIQGVSRDLGIDYAEVYHAVKHEAARHGVPIPETAFKWRRGAKAKAVAAANANTNALTQAAA